MNKTQFANQLKQFLVQASGDIEAAELANILNNETSRVNAAFLLALEDQGVPAAELTEIRNGIAKQSHEAMDFYIEQFKELRDAKA